MYNNLTALGAEHFTTSLYKTLRHERTRKDGRSLAQIQLRPGENLDAALRRFKKMTMESGILKEARAHEHYEKPSDKRRREEAARIRKIQKARRQSEAREGR